jgi:hypothetical protein
MSTATKGFTVGLLVFQLLMGEGDASTPQVMLVVGSQLEYVLSANAELSC